MFPRLSRLKKLLQTLACTARGLTNPDVTRATPNEENRALMIIQPSANVHSVTDIVRNGCSTMHTVMYSIQNTEI